MKDKIRFARMLRQASPDAERRLWSRLRRRQLEGVKFRRQVPLGPYIVDFLSLEQRLVIELDGGQHAGQEHHARDVERNAWLEMQGFRVLRFWNSDVLCSLEAVLETIRDEILR